MLKRLSLLLPLALLLAACSASDHGGATTATAPGAAQTTQAPANAPATAVTSAAVAAAGTAAIPAAAATSTATPSTATGATTASAATASSSGAASGTPSAAAAPVKSAKAAAFIDTGKWVEGKNYFVIQPTQPKATNTSKIEVVEIFSYGCPACFRAHTFIDKLAASLPADAVMAYLPAAFRPDENWPLYQRAYFAARALGIAAKSHDAMFEATWKTGETATYDLATGQPKPKAQWPGINDIAKFYTKYGVSADEFVAVANSFTINTKMKRADELIKDYGVPSTPTIVIDGKYRFDFSTAGGYAQGVELAQWLVAKEAAGK